MTDERLKALVDGLVPGALIGTGSGILVGILADVPGVIARFLVGVGALGIVFGGLAWATSGSLEDSLGDYAGDQDFTAADARRNALRLAGLGAGLALGGAVVWVGL